MAADRVMAVTARVSRMLLAAPDVMVVMPTILGELGEAAAVDRAVFALAETDADGSRWLRIQGEWIANGTSEQRSLQRVPLGDRSSDCFRAQLSAGRSVRVLHGEAAGAISIAGCQARNSLIVPFLVDGEYAGAIGFDHCSQSREFDAAAVAALEIAASVVGAALQREKLIETVRLERESAVEQRVAELAATNATLRASLERLASEPDPEDFLGHMLLEVTRQLGAAGGVVVTLDATGTELRVTANVRDGRLEPPAFPAAMPYSAELRAELANFGRAPRYYDIEHLPRLGWEGAYEYHQREGDQSVYLMPLIFGEQNVGMLSLAFRRRNALSSTQSELVVALGLQATLAIGLRRLAASAEDAAVLAERNRIGREIHDGLAQAFTGILMQLGAVEELAVGTPLAVVLGRVRDIARDGLSEARRSVLALRPQSIRPGGLELALRQLAERSTVDGRVSAVFEGGGVQTGLPPEHEHALLRIAQEAVSNAVRHAEPATIRIALAADADSLSLRVTDDGLGMDQQPERCAQLGFGLDNMRERAQAIGGAWRIDSSPGQGTEVSVRIPRPQRA